MANWVNSADFVQKQVRSSV